MMVEYQEDEQDCSNTARKAAERPSSSDDANIRKKPTSHIIFGDLLRRSKPYVSQML